MDSREAFYHGFLLGVLGNLDGYLVQSNRESGNGHLDICVRSLDVEKTPVILELKVSDTVNYPLSSSRYAPYEAYPSQIRTCGFPASGSLQS